MRAHSLLAVLVLLPTTARADTTLQGRVTVSAGVTDNAAWAPEEPPAGSTLSPPESDVFVELRPSVLLWDLQPRRVLTLRFDLSYLAHARDSQANTFAQHVGANAVFDLSERSLLHASAEVTHGRSYGAQLLQGSEATPGLDAVGDLEFVSARAREGFVHELSPTTGFAQELTLAMFVPIDFSTDETVDAPTTTSVANTLAVEKRWIRDRLVTEHVFTVGSFEREDGTHLQLINELAEAWVHELSRSWSTELRGGIGVVTPGDFSDALVYPAVSAQVGYDGQGHALVSASHGVTVSLPVAQTYVTDRVFLTGGLPFLRGDLYATFTLGAEESSVIDEDAGETTSEVSARFVDLGVSYRAGPGLDVSALYQFHTQEGVGGTIIVPTVTRGAFLVSASYTFPADVTGVRSFQSPADVARQRIREERGVRDEPARGRR